MRCLFLSLHQLWEQRANELLPKVGQAVPIMCCGGSIENWFPKQSPNYRPACRDWAEQVEEEMWRNIGREQGDQHLASPPSTLGCWGWAMFGRCYFRLSRHLNKLSVSEWKLFPKIHKPSRSLIVAFSEPKYLKKPYRQMSLTCLLCQPLNYSLVTCSPSEH